jgi:DNA polymerase-3 subunit delta
MAGYANKTYAEYKKQMKAIWTAPNLPGIIVAYGTSSFLHHKTSALLKKKVTKQYEIVHEHAAECSQNDFMAYCEMNDLFATKSFVIFKGVEKKADFAKYLGQLSSMDKLANVLLLQFHNAKLPAKFDQELKRLGAAKVHCGSVHSSEVNETIQDLLREHRVNLAPNAVALLREAHGDNLDHVENEIVKITLAFPDETRLLSRDEIAPLLGVFREDQVFQLDNLLMQKQTSKALTLLSELLGRGESALALLGVLSMHYRKSLKVLMAKRNGASPAVLASELRIPPFVVKQFEQYVSGHEPDYFMNKLRLCHESDEKLKFAKLPEEVVLAQIIA